MPARTPRRAGHLAAWLMSATLAACGGSDPGGSSGTPATSAPAPVAAPAPAPPPPAPIEPAPPPITPPSTAPGTLGAVPVIRVLRDDRVATLEMDYNAASPWGQFWTMTGSPDDDAGFLVVWWPQATTLMERTQFIAGIQGGACLSNGREVAAAGPSTKKLAAAAMTPNALDLPVGAKWLVTGNRRVQLQPLDNDRAYQVRVQRLSARGKVSSQAAEFTVNGGDATRVNALRASLTYFDDFNLPLGAADEKNWNNASMVSTDPRFNLFFINDQLHAHTLHGTNVNNAGDRSQTTQRFRKKMRLDSSSTRRIVFDMDSPLSPRSVWYLDLTPVTTDVTGHASFFDEEGAPGLPAGILRVRAQGQSLSVSIVDMQGASHRVAGVDMEERGRQAIPNVRRSFDVRLRTTNVQVFVDGAKLIDADFAPYTLPPADYEMLWVDFGYNTAKDAVPYYLHHWDNFGFDGPVVDSRTVHNYVTRIEGTDYQKVRRDSGQPAATFTVNIPDDLRPAVAGATAEAWLVYTYQMGDYSYLNVLPGDFIRVNGGRQYTMPQAYNNSTPLNTNLNEWGTPRTVRVKLGDLVQGGASPLVIGNNTFQFNADNAGVLNLHVEVLYPQGSAPAYTPPSAIHHVPLHSELNRMGPPVRFQSINSVVVEGDRLLGSPNPARIPVQGLVPMNIEVGNRSWSHGATQLMHAPVQSTEVWSSGGTTGLARLEVFLRRVGTGTGPGQLVLSLDTAVDAPAPQGRYLLQFDSRGFANGDYELFVEGTTPAGLKSHPSYGNEIQLFNANALSGAYYPIPIRIQN